MLATVVVVRLVAWNLNGDGSTKVPVAVDRLRPDVLVAAECKDPESFPASLLDAASTSAFVGRPDEEGLACSSYGEYRLRLDTEVYEPDLVRIAPIEVTGPVSFHLLAVWADNSAWSTRPAIQALDTYRGWLADRYAIVAGDFNDGPQWQRAGPLGWAATADGLAALGLRSTTPLDTPTLFLNRHLDQPYCVDHAFIPDSWQVDRAEVGSPDDWLSLSDHMPVVVDTQPPD